MTLSEFKQFLIALANEHRNLGESAEAEALEKLAELFDGQPNLRIATFVEQVRRLRRFEAA